MIENYAEKIKHESNGFIRHNGIRIVSVDEERSVLEAEITDNSRNVWGSIHGGFLYTMADTAAGAFARIRYGRRNVTLNGSMNYLRPTKMCIRDRHRAPQSRPAPARGVCASRR